jgi:type I restriction enzyme S subunit
VSEDNELPVGWVETTLGEVASINPRVDTSDMPDTTPVSFIPMAAVEAGTGHIDSSAQRKLHEVRKGYTAFQEEDILFAKITPCMENGKSAVAQSLSSKLGFGSTEFHVLRPEAGIDAKLLYYYISQESFRQMARTYMTGSAGQLRVPATFLVDVSYPLAPTNEQRRIVAAIEQQFTRLDAAVEALKQAQKKLKLYRSAVLKAAVEGKLTEGWRVKHPTTEPATTLLKRILQERRATWEADYLAKMAARGVVPKDDKWKEGYKEPAQPDIEGLPMLPEGWRWATLEQCSVRITDGTHQPPPFTASGIPFVFVAHIVKGSISFEKTKYISESTYKQLNARCPVEYGDILYSAVGSYGVAVPVLTHQPFSFQRHIAHIKPSKMLSMNYIAFCLNSPIGLHQAHQVARGVAQKTVTLTDLAQFVIPLASLVEQEQIVALVEEQLSIISELETMVEHSLKRAERERQSILQEAFAGRLVPQNPEDEPASVLLERIREERKLREEEERGARKQRGSTKMASQRTATNKQRKPLREVLQEAKQPITPDDLFRRAGLQDNDVDDFFADLRIEVLKGGIRQVRPDDTHVLLEAVGE